jgi:outer membrane protein insertion porin family
MSWASHMRSFSRPSFRWLGIFCCLIVAGMTDSDGKTEIRIRGLESMTENEVLQIIAGRLVYVSEKPANSWRANDAAYLVEQILHNEGFPEARVSGKIEANDQIVLYVSEGIRRSLGEVVIEGDDDSESLIKLFKSPFTKKSFLQRRDIPFRDEDVAEGLDFMVRQLQSRGFWRADVSIRTKEFDDKTGNVNLVIQVMRGERFRIGNPTVVSPDGRGVKRAATTWEPFVGMWATTENINKLKVAIIEAFISRGYPDAGIFMNRRLGMNQYYPEFRIELGVRVRLLEVDSKGLVRTRPKRINEIMKPLEGEWYDEAAMNQQVRKLLATGAFSSVRVETYEVSTKRINATLHFEESKAKDVALSGGYGSFNGPLFRSIYTDRNFRGQLRAFSAGFELNERGLLGEVKLIDPWWGRNVSRELRWYSMNKSYGGYGIFESGLESRWKWSLSDHFSLGFLLGYSFSSVDGEGLPSAFLGDHLYSHARVGFIPDWDYRDSAVLPTSGWHLSLPFQLGSVVGRDENGYFKFGMDGGWYHAINRTYQLGVGGYAEWVMPSGDIQDLPIDLRVFNGGSRSVRSFPERGLGPTLGGAPYGGDFSWAVQTELSRPIRGALRAVSFMDVGGVSGNYTAPMGGGLEVAVGLGLRLDLPIGPVRLEYGHNLTRDRGEPPGTWHFAIGATF